MGTRSYDVNTDGSFVLGRGFFRISDRENQVFRCPLGNDNDLEVGYKDVHVSPGFKS